MTVTKEHRLVLNIEVLKKAFPTEPWVERLQTLTPYDDYATWRRNASQAGHSRRASPTSLVAGRWTGLTRILEDPQIPLDNNIAEAGFVGLALGRRNYVGCRSERGMTVATTFDTLFESARVCGSTPDEHLRYAAEALLARSEPLLPQEWVAHQRLATNAPT